MLMTSCFVCATLNLGRKKSTGTEPMSVPNAETRSSLYIRLFFCITINFTLSGVANTNIVTCIVIFHGMFFPYAV